MSFDVPAHASRSFSLKPVLSAWLRKGEDALQALGQRLGIDLIDDSHRAIRARFAGAEGALLDRLLQPQQVHIHEAVNGRFSMVLTCLCTSAELPEVQFLGLPIQVQIVTDRGHLSSRTGFVQAAERGAGDGDFIVVQLTAVDVLTLMDQHVTSRVFRDGSVLDIARELFDELLQRHPPLAFDHRLVQIDEARYPKRAQTLQLNEPSGRFLERLLRYEGISWIVRHPDSEDGPRQRLDLFDHTPVLDENPAGEVRHHGRLDGTEQRDSIIAWASRAQLVPGKVVRHSPDYQQAPGGHRAEAPLMPVLGETGCELAAALLHDERIEAPHAGHSREHHEQLTHRRAQHHELNAGSVIGTGDVRDFTAGTYITLTDHRQFDGVPREQREFVLTSVEHWGRNNLPKDLQMRAQALVSASAGLNGWNLRPAWAEPWPDRPYLNRFTAVPRSTGIVPEWQPQQHLPPTPPMSAVVLGGDDGSPVHCDPHGRVRVAIDGMRSGQDATAWVQWSSPWRGPLYGVQFLPRAGMRVRLGFMMGDPSKPCVEAVLSHAFDSPPVAFGGLGSLPHNKALSGIRTQEFGGMHFSQLCFDDTRAQVGFQLGSSWAHTGVRGGWVGSTRRDGQSKPRGIGLEARTDGQLAARGARGVYISAEAADAEDAPMLQRDVLLGVAQALQSIQQELGRLSQQHQAGGTEGRRLEQLVRRLQDWEHGSNTAPEASGGGAPMVAVSGPGGIALGSGEHLLLGAQTTVDAVSGADTRLSAGQELVLRAMQAISLFAHAQGLRLVAASGDVQVQAQQGSVAVTAGDDLVLTARRRIVIQAPEVQVIGQGAATQWGVGSIVEQASGAFAVKSADFVHSSGGDGLPQGLQMPASDLKTDEKYVLRLRGGGTPARRRYRIELDDGRVSEGVSDAQGRTQLAQADALRIASVVLLDD